MKTEKVLVVALLGGIGYWLWTQSQGGGSNISVAQKRQWLIQYVQQGNDSPGTKQAMSVLFGQTMTDTEINVVYKVIHDFIAKGMKPSAALRAQFDAIGVKYNIFT